MRIDVVYGRLSPRRQALIDLAGNLLFLLPMAVLIGWLSWAGFQESYHIGETSPDAGGLLRWPVKLAIPLGFLTAWHMLVARAALAANEDILLHAAGSGVTSAGIQIARLLGARRILVTAHDAFNYLSRAYGIEVLGIQGISTESEAGLKDINRIVDILVTRNVPAVFVETSVSDKNVKALIEGAAARGHRVTIGGEIFSDAMGKSGTYESTYIGMIDHNVTTISRALGGNAPVRGMSGKLSLKH